MQLFYRNPLMYLVMLLALGLCLGLHAQEAGPEAPAATTEALTKMRIAVLDFASVDIEAEKYLRHTEKKSTEADSPWLTPEDRASLSQEDLGAIKKREIQDRINTRLEARRKLEDENERERQKKEKIRKDLLGEKAGRSVVIGADIMAAYLSGYQDVFEIVDRKKIEESIKEMEFGRSGLVESGTAAQLAQMVGATHLLYGIIQDFSQEERQYSGYGIKTNNIHSKLDVLIKIIDVDKQTIVFNQEFTGEVTELKTEFSEHKTTSLHSDLMKKALKQAAKAIYARFKPPPMPVSQLPQKPKITVSPRGDEKDTSFNPNDAEIYVDGAFKGNAPATLEVLSGRHKIEIKMDGYKTKSFEMNIEGGEILSPKMVRETPQAE